MEQFFLDFLLDLFESIHFVLIFISHKKKIKLHNCYESFKAFVVNVNELKGVGSYKVLYCYYDLMEANILNSAEDLLIDFEEFRDFANKNGPEYIKNMIHRL